MLDLLKKHIFLLLLVIYCTLLLLVTVKMNVFRYNNFDFGKFDLGNMTQMVWNTLHGRFMYLTDYFGTNLPRWAMSHVDPILLLFVPVFVFFPHPLTLIIAQVILVIFSALILYKIVDLKTESGLSAFLISVAFLAYPALGFLLAWSGFHGVTVAIPFFLGAFYVLELMHKSGNYSVRREAILWILLITAMTGKEEISLFVLMLGIFVWLVHGRRKLGFSLILTGFLWFVVAFFVVIPAYSGLRVAGYEKFVSSLGINRELANDVANPNFFLGRYSGFGDSYLEVAFNMVTHPRQVVRVVFGGDKLENLHLTLSPLAYTSILYFPLFAVTLPEFFINYATTAGGIGTSEIYNHRISLIIPVLFLASLYAICLISEVAEEAFKLKRKYVTLALSALVFFTNFYTTFKFENPIYLWVTQALSKRISTAVLAKTIELEKDITRLAIGDRFNFSPLEGKDRDCALKIVRMIPDSVSVSGPDYLGAHLAMRETYAIFPALYNSADYVIIDVFAEKVSRVLGLEKTITRDVARKTMIDENYKLAGACGNLFVFKNIGPHGKTKLLPVQERFEFTEQVSYEIFQALTVVSYTIPSEIKRNEAANANFVYTQREDKALNGYILFITLLNSDTYESYQFANLPSFGLNEVGSWTKGRYYTEDIEIVLPTYLAPGSYKFFIGMDNKVRTRSIYLGDVTVL